MSGQHTNNENISGLWKSAERLARAEDEGIKKAITEHAALWKEVVSALLMAREFISFGRNAFADCNGLPDGTFSDDAAAELAEYDAALLEINAAIAKAEGHAV